MTFLFQLAGHFQGDCSQTSFQNTETEILEPVPAPRLGGLKSLSFRVVPPTILSSKPTAMNMLLKSTIFVMLCGCQVAPLISPHERTVTNVEACLYRIHLFAKANKTVPASLKELAARQGYADSIVDAWGNELLYEVDPRGTLLVSSLGRNCKAGGAGDDSDYQVVLRWMDTDGKLIADDNTWIASARDSEK